jgi:hypothetical protein
MAFGHADAGPLEQRRRHHVSRLFELLPAVRRISKG